MTARFALLAGAVALIVAVAFGPAPKAVDALLPDSCQKPVTQMQSETQRAGQAIDDYVAIHIAKRFEKPALVDWEVVTYRLTPARVTLVLYVYQLDGSGYFSAVSRNYNVMVERECAAGEWTVTEFVLVKGQKPEPKAA